MIKGIATADYFVIIATKDSFTRQWPLFELMTAEALGKPMIVAIEADIRHGCMSLDQFSESIPKPWQFLRSHEILQIKRRRKFWAATVDELHERLSKETKSEIR